MNMKRRWGPYPALRRVLADRQVPNKYYGISSVSDNMFNSIQRLLELSVLIRENDSAIHEAVATIGVEPLCEDLEEVRKELSCVGHMFENETRQITDLLESVYDQRG